MKIYKWAILLIAATVFISCGGGEKAEAEKKPVEATDPSGLSKAELEHGVGPIKAFTLGAADAAKAAKGKAVFEVKCVACHKVDERLVGPPLKGVLERRSPAFILNMVLNPAEMVKRHPEVQKMLAQYYVPMTFQNVTEEEAREILEYLRTL